MRARNCSSLLTTISVLIALLDTICVTKSLASPDVKREWIHRPNTVHVCEGNTATFRWESKPGLEVPQAVYVSKMPGYNTLNEKHGNNISILHNKRTTLFVDGTLLIFKLSIVTIADEGLYDLEVYSSTSNVIHDEAHLRVISATNCPNIHHYERPTKYTLVPNDFSKGFGYFAKQNTLTLDRPGNISIGIIIPSSDPVVTSRISHDKNKCECQGDKGLPSHCECEFYIENYGPREILLRLMFPAYMDSITAISIKPIGIPMQEKTGRLPESTNPTITPEACGPLVAWRIAVAICILVIVCLCLVLLMKSRCNSTLRKLALHVGFTQPDSGQTQSTPNEKKTDTKQDEECQEVLLSNAPVDKETTSHLMSSKKPRLLVQDRLTKLELAWQKEIQFVDGPKKDLGEEAIDSDLSTARRHLEIVSSIEDCDAESHPTDTHTAPVKMRLFNDDGTFAHAHLIYQLLGIEVRDLKQSQSVPNKLKAMEANQGSNERKRITDGRRDLTLPDSNGWKALHLAAADAYLDRVDMFMKKFNSHEKSLDTEHVDWHEQSAMQPPQ